MNRTSCGLAFLALALAGCTDNISLMARDMRNLNNEAVDAVMMVTNDAQAKIAWDRVLSLYDARVKHIEDNRLKPWQMRESKEKAVEVLTSDSMALLLAENKANAARLATEAERLEKVKKDLGDAPNLTELLAKAGKESPLMQNLLKGGVLRAEAVQVTTNPKVAPAVKDLLERFNGRVQQFAVDGKADKLEPPQQAGNNMMR